MLGALTLCAAEPDAFDGEMIELLSEAAGDLAYGIATRRAAVEQARTRTDLRRLERQSTLILNASGEGIYGVDLEGRITLINPAGAAMLNGGQVARRFQQQNGQDVFPATSLEPMAGTDIANPGQLR